MEKLLDGTGCQIILDTRASKSFMCKSHYLCCKSLHSVMYSSAVLAYLRCLGVWHHILLLLFIGCTAIHNTHLQVPLS